MGMIIWKFTIWMISNQHYSGGLGNRLFQVNFIIQIALALKDNYYINNCNLEFIKVKQYSRFKNLLFNKKINQELFSNLLSINDLSKFKNKQICFTALGEYYNKYTIVNPKKIFSLNPICKKNEYIAVHYRGGDFLNSNIRCNVPLEYYIESIDFFLKKSIDYNIDLHLVTDDQASIFFTSLTNYLNQKKIPFIINSGANVQLDFNLLKNSKYLVASPSTFCIWSYILGDQEAITQSAKWVFNYSDEAFWDHVNKNDMKFLENKFTLI